MSQLELIHDTDAETIDPGWKSLCRIGGVAALIMVACAIITMIVVITLGGEPGTASESFTLLQSVRLVELLRLDIPSMSAWLFITLCL
ncbi:MAG: hypothetical protein A2Z14_07670 [Chloroflexi bacterium RBG_16_48_8]|nr:MAG: hypothetical protein A2Z14_07670 [Chloroflexi bacterium RBG_16_48_8]